MWRFKEKALKYIAVIMMLSVFMSFGTVKAFAYTYEDLPEGTYRVNSSLSCYVNAMGGVEFGAPLLKASEVHVSANGEKSMTLYFTKSSVTIYNITCDTFIDASPSYVTEDKGVKSGTIGVYDASGRLITDKVSYTLSSDTAENAQKEKVNYVDSITFPISHKSDSYNLTFYINSNVMGVQFCNSIGGSSSSYPATLKVDWNSLPTKPQDAVEENTQETVTDKENVVVDRGEEAVDKVETTEDKEKPVLDKEEESEDKSSGNVEAMDGLNIYHADEDANVEEVKDKEINYLAFYNLPVIMITGCVAVMVIIIGIVLVIMSKRGEKNV
ncbi:hypothetical protein ACPWSR_03335 [Alloiococcus sp. CFN-8]|uniref:hypothetical protein n=1 Tax=Alloiococcus sp. CFN-8 TaxID=3416081 RepID=UPI003CF3003E